MGDAHDASFGANARGVTSFWTRAQMNGLFLALTRADETCPNRTVPNRTLRSGETSEPRVCLRTLLRRTPGSLD
jgi:hypothetical protein